MPMFAVESNRSIPINYSIRYDKRRSNSLQLNKNEKRQPIPNAARKPREPSRRDAPRGRKDCVPFPSGLERADIVDVANVVLAETGTAGLN